MFIKTSWYKKGDKKYYTYQIAESYRPKGVKHPRTKILANVTCLGKPLIDKLKILLKNPDAVIIEELNSFFKESYVLGPILFLYLFMKEMGIIDCMKGIPEWARKLLIGVIINRIVEPKSKLGTVSWIKKTAYPYLMGMEGKKYNVSEIYKAMDILYDRLEEVLEEFFRKNGLNTILLLYDITSIFFEGNKIGTNGFSRDGCPENKQILLSLVLNEKRLPVYFDILEGNVSDKKSVIPMLEELKKRFNLQKSIFIGDRGMVSTENIEYLGKEGIDYIVALTHRGARELVLTRGINLDLFDDRVPVDVFEEDGKRYILCTSEYRKEHNRKTLERLLKKGREALEAVERMVSSGRIKDRDKVIKRAQKKLTQAGCENYYDFAYEDGKFEIIEKPSIQKAQALCGYYVLETTVDEMEAKEIEANYKNLKFVESAFKQLKDLVEIRPIFHWKERRVKTHIFLCILAQTVVNKIIEELKINGWLDEAKENSFSSFIDSLHQISLGIFEIDNKRIPIINQLNNDHRKILKIFNMNIDYFIDFQKAKQAVVV